MRQKEANKLTHLDLIYCLAQAGTNYQLVLLCQIDFFVNVLEQYYLYGVQPNYQIPPCIPQDIMRLFQ